MPAPKITALKTAPENSRFRFSQNPRYIPVTQNRNPSPKPMASLVRNAVSKSRIPSPAPPAVSQKLRQPNHTFRPIPAAPKIPKLQRLTSPFRQSKMPLIRSSKKTADFIIFSSILIFSYPPHTEQGGSPPVSEIRTVRIPLTKPEQFSVS